MLTLDLFERLNDHAKDEAIIHEGNSFTYRDLINAGDEYRYYLYENGVRHGAIVALIAEPSFHAIAFLLALWERGAIVVPRLRSTPNFCAFQMADPEWVVNLHEDASFGIERDYPFAINHHYDTLRKLKHPGLVVFTSGTTGEQKGIVHDLERVFGKFAHPRRAYRMISFLQHDHFGGINTLLYALTSGSTLIIPKDRSTETVLTAVGKHRANLLPITPTFLLYMAMAVTWEAFNLSSLELVTYGSEMGDTDVISHLARIFPDIEFRQTYGLSELGVLHSKSKANDSLWVKVGGPGFETRVVDGVLWVKSESSMLGYLDGTDPFKDGWYDTGDLVDVDGEYVRFRGRRDD